MLTVEFPFVNVLAMEHEDFENSKLELLKLILPYKYKKNPSLPKDKNEQEFKNTVDKISSYFKTFDESDKDRIVISELLANIFKDVHNIEKNNKDEYGKAVEIMGTANLPISEIIKMDAKKVEALRLEERYWKKILI